jgi:hypothetical protein
LPRTGVLGIAQKPLRSDVLEFDLVERTLAGKHRAIDEPTALWAPLRTIQNEKAAVSGVKRRLFL